MRNLIKKNPRYSKRINYDALRDLFDGAGPSGAMEDDKVNVGDEMWTMDPDKDDEMEVVIEESGGAVGSSKQPEPAHEGPSTGGDEDGEGEYDDDMYAEKGDDYVGEWDVYEQEV